MTEPSKLVEKTIGRPNTAWNSVKQWAVASVGVSAISRSACACDFNRRDYMRFSLAYHLVQNIVYKGLFLSILGVLAKWFSGNSLRSSSKWYKIDSRYGQSFFC